MGSLATLSVAQAMTHTGYLLGCTCFRCLGQYIEMHAHPCSYGKTPKPQPPDSIKTPQGIGINQFDGKAKS